MSYALSTTPVGTVFGWFSNALSQIQSLCNLITSQTNNSGSVSAATVINLAESVFSLNSIYTTAATNSNLVVALGTYAQQQLANSSLNYSASITTLNSLAQDIYTGLGQDYPVDANGYLLDRKWGSNGQDDWINLTAAQLPHVMPAIANFLAGLD